MGKKTHVDEFSESFPFFEKPPRGKAFEAASPSSTQQSEKTSPKDNKMIYKDWRERWDKLFDEIGKCPQCDLSGTCLSHVARRRALEREAAANKFSDPF